LFDKLFYSKIFAVITLCCLGFIIYSNTFNSSFHLDDYLSIVQNEAVKPPLQIINIWNFWPTRFITYLSFAFNYHFHKLNVFGYHLFNLTVHLCSALLVWWLTLLTFSTPKLKDERIAQHANLLALFVGLIFVTHPLQTQAITYIIQRATSLATLFYLVALSLYVKSRLLQQEKNTSYLGKLYYCGSIIAAVSAMFTKEMAITLPLVVLLYEFCFFKKQKRLNWRMVAPFLITLLIIPLTMLLTKTADISEMKLAVEPVSGISPGHYFLTQLRVLVTYLRLLFLPINQNLDYDYSVVKTIFALPVLYSLIFLTAVFIAAILIHPKHRLISFGIFWFFLTLLPESSIIPIKDLIFEHRLYLALIGFSLFLVGTLYALLGKKNLNKMIIVLLLMVTVYSILTYTRNIIWKDEFSLWDDTVRKSPRKARPYYNRATAYFAKGEFSQAINDYTRTLEIEPGFAFAYNNRGNAYIQRGNLEQAIIDYNQAIKINPNYVLAYYNRGNAYNNKGNLNFAVTDFTKAIEINPRFVFAYYARAGIYKKMDNLDQAIADYSNAIRIDPFLAGAYYGRGTIYSLKHEYTKSWEDLHKAEALGYKISPEILEEAKKASGRNK